MIRRNWNNVCVTGSTGFIGQRVVTALVNAGANVTVLVHPENEEKLGILRRHVQIVTGDIWNSASLKGRSRGQGVIIHLVGSRREQPERGLTFQQINLAPARNVIGMAVGDGVPYFILLSAVSRPPGVSVDYLRSKREAEDYLRNSGLRWTIIRAPMVFDRAQPGGAFFAALSWVGALPLLRIFFGRRVPLPTDIAARGIVQAALQTRLPPNQVLYAGDLRRLGRPKKEERPRLRLPAFRQSMATVDDLAEEDIPFGWLPPQLPPDDE